MSRQYDNNFMWWSGLKKGYLWSSSPAALCANGIITLLSEFMSSRLNMSCLSTHRCDNCQIVAGGWNLLSYPVWHCFISLWCYLWLGDILKSHVVVWFYTTCTPPWWCPTFPRMSFNNYFITSVLLTAENTVSYAILQYSRVILCPLLINVLQFGLFIKSSKNVIFSLTVWENGRSRNQKFPSGAVNFELNKEKRGARSQWGVLCHAVTSS